MSYPGAVQVLKSQTDLKDPGLPLSEIPRREFRHQRFEFQIDKEMNYMVPVRPVGEGGGPMPFVSSYDPRLGTADPNPNQIYTKALTAVEMERGIGHYWMVQGSSRIETPPMSLNSVDSHIPCPGDIFVHLSDLERQIWIMTGAHNWQSIPADSGYVMSAPKKPMSSYIKHPEKPLYLRYEPGKNSRPKWILLESLKHAVRGMNLAEKKEDAGAKQI